MNIKNLAQHLELSIGTVSRALNGKPDVSAETRKRVLDAAVALGYSANASGRSLRRGTTQTVALMLETGQSDLRAGDNFFMRVIDGMQPRLDAEGYDLVILPCHSSTDPTDFLKRVIARGMADAMVVTATRRDDPRIDLLLQSRLPFLTLGRDQHEDRHAWIDLDFPGIVHSTMDRLAALGHHRVAVTAPKGGSNIAHLLQDAYVAAHDRLGLPCDPSLVVPCEVSEFGGNEVTRALLDRPDPPTAILLNHELMAFGVYAALADAGLTPGRDMSVVALRRSRQLRFLHPPVSAFEIDLEGLGTALAEEILRAIKGDTPPAARVWPFQLVATESLTTAPDA